MYNRNDKDYSIKELMEEYKGNCLWPELKTDFNDYLLLLTLLNPAIPIPNKTQTPTPTPMPKPTATAPPTA